MNGSQLKYMRPEQNCIYNRYYVGFIKRDIHVCFYFVIPATSRDFLVT